MNSIIEFTRGGIFSLVDRQKLALAQMTTVALRDLIHDCEELRYNVNCSTRMAAEINLTAATLELEKRG